MEREALAVIWSVLRLRHLLLGRQFTLVSDHKPLQKIFGEGGLPKVASARLVRWALLLQPYDFIVAYKPGPQIPHADALTRLRHSRHFPEDDFDIVINNIAFEPEQAVVDTERVRYYTQHDKVALSVMKRIKSGRWSSCSPLEVPFKRVRHALTIENSMIYLGTRLYVPFSLRRDIFNAAHSVHSGIQSTLNKMKFSSWWPAMDAQVSKWVAECTTCSQIRPRLGRDRGQWPEAKPFERLNMDWCYIDGVGNVLVMVDSGSGWIEAFRHKERTSAAVISSLREVCSRFGVPHVLISDNGAEFVSDELNKWCLTNGIEKKETPPYDPAANGTAERAVQTVKRGMRAWRFNSVHVSFDIYLQRLLFHHRTYSRRPCGKTPGELVFGRPLRAPVLAKFHFGEQVVYRPCGHPPRSASFVMGQGTNTSWILDGADSSRLILAHANQLAPSGATPTVSAVTGSPAEQDGHLAPAEAPTSSGVSPPPDAFPSVPNSTELSTEAVLRRSTRIRRVQQPTDYEDL